MIPPRLQLADEWTLAYSLERDGVSLATLYEKCERFRGGARRGFVVVVKDGSGGVGLSPFFRSLKEKKALYMI